MTSSLHRCQRALTIALLLLLSACGAEPPTPAIESAPFTIAVIPDTQNYISYSHQKAEGFAMDSSELFIQQMQSVAQRGDIAFVAAVGDVWQHQTLDIDPGHAARGFKPIANPFFSRELAPTEKTLSVEIPRAIEGYRLLDAAGIPFGVAPGNHDYDAMWSAEGFPPNLATNPGELTMTPEDLGILHIGGLDNFRSVFGDKGEFFNGKPWYVSSYNGGADSAQTFSAGGYTFLHIALEMAAGDDVLAWAESVIKAHPGLPTIISTHDYLDPQGERRANPIVDLKRVDPEHHNTAQEYWSKLISRNDQVFLVLCGHHHGHSWRADDNTVGHKVYQILADYQHRGQAGIDAGQPPDRFRGSARGIGDGWYRLMRFELGGERPRVQVKTYSSFYQSLSGDLDTYSSWYKNHTHAGKSDAEFLASEDFIIELTDFRERFGLPQ
jgi:hypothetical protein